MRGGRWRGRKGLGWRVGRDADAGVGGGAAAG